MNYRGKILISFLIFLGANGASLSLLFSGDQLNKLFSRSLFERGSSEKDLFRNKLIQQISVYSQKVEKTDINSLGSLETTSSVEVSKENLVLFPATEEITEDQEKEPSESIDGIFTEIKREDGAEKVKRGYERDLKTSKEKLRDSSEGFQEATISLVRYSSESPVLRGISEKSGIQVNPEERFSLSQGNRQALKNFFYQYSELGEKKGELNSQLQKVIAIESESSRARRRRNSGSPFSNPYNQKVLSALEQINWDKNINWDSLYNKWKNVEWGEKNLFHALLESEEVWKQWLKKVQDAQNEQDNYLSNGWRRLCGLAMMSNCYKDLGKYKEKVAKAKSSLELRIGEKLMGDMGRVIKTPSVQN
ncbi:hypothetical protein MSUIS_05760 [Mycoplasma suis KI3806]|uniref:Uncharacterized protein n=1 Tax=Mycoplasma suis (strain KI_3806) TaxID=708248 RepID=F0V1Y8_MYCS3|nr:hypothetical protein [Mycoplasma suis]CBZ40669.1 hypothetical protein MSUIS_05760 [Mycoplasma suis KI3806]